MPSTVNRGYIYPDEYSDSWYNLFVAMMQAVDDDVAALQPGALTESVKIKAASPNVRLKGTENGGGDVRMVESAGGVLIQKNVGSENAPSWSTLMSISAAGVVTATGLATAFYSDTYANLKVISRSLPTDKLFGYDTDDDQLLFYCGDATKNDEGWRIVA